MTRSLNCIHWLQNGADDEEMLEQVQESLLRKKNKQTKASAKVVTRQSKRTIDSVGAARAPVAKKSRKKAKEKH